MISRLHCFARNRCGAAFVELAIVMPVLVVIYLGCWEIVGIVRGYMKTANAAQALAELVAGATTNAVSSSDISNYCNGAKLVMSPLSVSGTKFSAAIYSYKNNGGAIVVASNNWPDTTNCGNGQAVANPTTVVTPLLPNDGDSTIMVNVTYSFTSPIRYLLPSTMTITQVAFARPRQNTAVTHN